MDKEEMYRLLTLANMVELNKRVICKLVGDDLSTRIDGADVAENAEVLVTSKMSEKLLLKLA